MQKKFHIKKGDTVIVITGNYKGQKGRVLEVIRKSDRAIVEGVNMIKKHAKPDAKNPQGGIIEKESFNLVGFKKRVPIIFKGVNPEIEKMTELLTPEVVKQLKSISNVEPKGIISASTNFSEGRMEEKGELDHYIGVATTSNETAEYDILNIDAGTWAIFESIGPFPETLQNIWGRIYSEWFPSSGYEAVEGPEILWNESPDTSNPKYRSEIWIPVKKKDN